MSKNKHTPIRKPAEGFNTVIISRLNHLVNIFFLNKSTASDKAVDNIIVVLNEAFNKNMIEVTRLIDKTFSS